MENHLYQFIYDILHSNIPDTAKAQSFNGTKQKLRLRANKMEKAMLDTDAQDRLDGKDPSLFHILKMIKRRETRTIRQVKDQQGNILTEYHEILNTFITHF
jgi:hypothetical protein